MAKQPNKEFGKRRPQLPSPATPPPKRSSHVALLLMGTLAVGGGAYALMPAETCTPPSPGMAAPALPQANGTTCVSRGSSGGGGYSGSSRYSFYSGDGSSGHSSSASSSSEAASGSVTRGGFGSFARAFGFSGG